LADHQPKSRQTDRQMDKKEPGVCSVDRTVSRLAAPAVPRVSAWLVFGASGSSMFGGPLQCLVSHAGLLFMLPAPLNSPPSPRLGFGPRLRWQPLYPLIAQHRGPLIPPAMLQPIGRWSDPRHVIGLDRQAFLANTPYPALSVCPAMPCLPCGAALSMPHTPPKLLEASFGSFSLLPRLLHPSSDFPPP